jgi:uncharacterized protein (TIGR02118 family)
MFKMVILAKRKPGMSLEAFKTYYETRHAPLACSMPHQMARYKRTYLTPMQGGEEGPFDVVTETWFKDKAAFDKNFQELLGNPERMAVIQKDEENLFDRSTITFFTAEECETEFEQA